MAINPLTFCAAWLLLVGCVSRPPAAESNPGTEARCREFLSHLIPVHQVSQGTQIGFTGEFTAIPVSLEKDLSRLFPEYTFRIANMTFVHWGPEPVRLLLVLDRRSNTVRTYLWDVWFTDEPFSFGKLFSQQGATSDLAKERITGLARLICFQMGWTAGESTIEDDVVFAPLINPKGQVWRVIRSRVTPGLPFEPLSIVRPGDKRKKPEQ